MRLTEKIDRDNSNDIVSQKRRNSREGLQIIKKAIEQKTPFSFVRIGDADAKILGVQRDYPNESVEQTIYHWWKQETVDWDELEWLRSELIKSANSANILGFFDEELDNAPSQFLKAGMMLRKYCNLEKTEAFLTLEASLEWQDNDWINLLVQNQKVVSLITCYDLMEQFASKFNVETVLWMPIPGHARYTNETRLNYKHYPDRMKEMLNHIRPAYQGHLFLVGAGVLGKIYCRVIKERGGIAVDLGSVFDNWAGNKKRGSVKKHRMGL